MHTGRTFGQTHSPEVVDQDVEDAENDNEKRGAPLGLETDDNHDASHKANGRNNDSSNGPGSTENKAHKEEDEQDTTSKLKVHFAVLFLKLGKTGKDLRLAHPRVGEDHQETTHDGQVAEEEVEVENEAVAESLDDDDSNETSDGVIGVLAGNNERGANGHGNDVQDQEYMGETAGNCRGPYVSAGGIAFCRITFGGSEELVRGWELTVTVVVEVEKLVAPLCYYAQSVLKEGNNNQETANCREIAINRDMSARSQGGSLSSLVLPQQSSRGRESRGG